MRRRRKRRPSNRFTVKGPDGKKYKSIEAMCYAYGIKPCTYYNRVYHGWDKKKALTEPIHGSPYGKHGKETEGPDGKTYSSMQAMCRAYGVDYQIFISRIKKGWDKKRALEQPVRVKSKKVTDHLGNEYPSIQAMCRAYDIGYYLYKTRRKQGWTLEESLETPVVKQGLTKKGLPACAVTTEGPNGETFPTVTDACKAYGMSVATFSQRKKEGMSDAEALSEPDHRKMPIKGPDGTVYKSKREMCRALDIPYCTYMRYARRGYTVEEALEAYRPRKREEENNR